MAAATAARGASWPALLLILTQVLSTTTTLAPLASAQHIQQFRRSHQSQSPANSSHPPMTPAVASAARTLGQPPHQPPHQPPPLQAHHQLLTQQQHQLQPPTPATQIAHHSQLHHQAATSSSSSQHHNIRHRDADTVVPSLQIRKRNLHQSLSNSPPLSANGGQPQQPVDVTAEYRRNFVRDMMKHAWHGYAKYAWGYNEVKPVSLEPHTDSIFGAEKMGATIIDAIDTLYIMGLHDEYLAARTWIQENLNFNKHDVDLSVFETNIRYVGGLLSIYALTKDSMYLHKAVDIADKIMPAFDSPSGIPYSNVNLRTGYARNHDWAYSSAILSEFGSMHLELIYLSHVTGDPKYRDKVMKVRQVIKTAVPRPDGLYNNYINTDTGQWVARPTHISIGALGDSFYEYLIKSYVQSDGADRDAYTLYIDAMKAYEDKLMFTSNQTKLLYFGELKETYVNHKMDSLACFAGGMLALGAQKSAEPLRSHHMTLAEGIASTCHESCIRTRSHLCPETFAFNGRNEATATGLSEKYYILRPEVLETYFYMWRYTHDQKYRDWAWDIVEALEKYCKAEGGYSGLRNVYVPAIKDDVQQTFFLAEVLKYLYLIFSPDNVINLNDWVFNTEAHPLPIIRPNMTMTTIRVRRSQ